MTPLSPKGQGSPTRSGLRRRETPYERLEAVAQAWPTRATATPTSDVRTLGPLRDTVVLEVALASRLREAKLGSRMFSAGNRRVLPFSRQRVFRAHTHGLSHLLTTLAAAAKPLSGSLCVTSGEGSHRATQNLYVNLLPSSPVPINRRFGNDDLRRGKFSVPVPLAKGSAR